MHIDLKTTKPGVLAHITWPDSKKYPIKLRGHAIDTNGVRIDGAKDICRTVTCPNDMETKKQMIAYIVGQNCLLRASKSHAHTSASALDDTTPMVVAYQRLNDHPEFLSGWSEVTAHAALTQFQRQILPTLSRYGTAEYPIFTEADLDELKKDLMARIAENGNSKGSPKINNRTMLQTLAASQKIYDAMVRLDPTLPDISLAVAKTVRRIATEQMKALPSKVRERFIELLSECMVNEPLMVRQTTILVDAGARTAEAAAVIPAIDFVDIEGATSLYVAWQEKGGKRCAKLKSKNGYRFVPLSMWGKTMVAQCDKILGAAAIPPDTSCAPVLASALAAWVKAKLFEAGLTAEEWQQYEKEELEKPERDEENRPYIDTTAYVLRRDRSTVWQHICALTSKDCDYLLGHAIYLSKEECRDYRLPTEQRRIAACLERFVANPAISLHPGIAPIELRHGLDLDIIPFSNYQFINNTDLPLVIDVNLDSVIPGDFIRILAEKRVKVDIEPAEKRYKFDAPRIVIGDRKEDQGDGQ